MRMSDWSSDLCSSDLKVVRGGLMHGKTSPVSHDGTGLFEGLPSPFTATRYHSLVVQDIPPELIVNATSNDTMVMGFRHSSLPIHGEIGRESGRERVGKYVEIPAAAGS